MGKKIRMFGAGLGLTAALAGGCSSPESGPPSQGQNQASPTWEATLDPATSTPDVAPSATVLPDALERGAQLLIKQEGYKAPDYGKVTLIPNKRQPHGSNMCAWTPQTPQPQPKEGFWQVDGRCASPMHASERPEDDKPSGAYLVPQQDSSRISFRVRSGEPVKPNCYTGGDPVEDGIHNTSRLWVAVGQVVGGKVVKEGLLPAFTIGYAIPDTPCSPGDLTQIASGAPIA